MNTLIISRNATSHECCILAIFPSESEAQAFVDTLPEHVRPTLALVAPEGAREIELARRIAAGFGKFDNGPVLCDRPYSTERRKAEAVLGRSVCMRLWF